MLSQSPLKAKPLQNPGDSVDEEIRRWTDDRALEPLFFAVGFFLIAGMEWFGYLTNSPRRPILFSGVALAAIAIAAWRIWVIRPCRRAEWPLTSPVRSRSKSHPATRDNPVAEIAAQERPHRTLAQRRDSYHWI
jgi:hypothetical protein